MPSLETRVASAAHCPMESGWRLWRSFRDPRKTLSVDTIRRVEQARRAVSGEIIGTVYPSWTVAPDDATVKPMTVEESKDAAWRFAEGPWHVHADLAVGSSAVHLDIVGATRNGPHNHWMEVRIHVDGQLAGLAGAAGISLGGSSCSLPAVGLVGDVMVMVALDRFRVRPAPRVLLRRWRTARDPHSSS